MFHVVEKLAILQESWLVVKRLPLKTYSSYKLVETYLYRVSGAWTLRCKDKSILRGLCMCHLNRASKRWIICQILAGLLQLFVSYGVAATLKLAKDRASSYVHSGLATGFRRRKETWVCI